MSDAPERHAARRDRLAARLREGGGRVGLGKETSNLFRDRAGPQRRRLDVRDFREVLRVDPAAGIVEAEGMASYEELVADCLPRGVMPAVVPQLKTITLGGAVAGVGIEASSHRYGLVHESALELEVLTGDGQIVVCRPDNEHADLFYALPNSYGTLGYALRVVATDSGGAEDAGAVADPDVVADLDVARVDALQADRALGLDDSPPEPPELAQVFHFASARD